jgi:hypothetical protein
MIALHERCQFENTVCRYVFPFGQARAVKRAVLRAPDRFAARAARKPSRYAPGDIVRVKDAAAVRTMLDARGRTRGLAFTSEQWAYCGAPFRSSAGC